METYIKVNCKECNVEYYKIKEQIKIWSGLCRSCAAKKRNITHGMSHTSIYRRWTNMNDRCLNKKNKRYNDYGGRGITICKEWNNFITFEKWSKENGYNENLTLDRMNNDKGYSPDNCHWVNRSIQNQNKRKNKNSKNKYRGINLTNCNKFRATIYLNRKKIFDQTFDLEMDALNARNNFIINNNLNHTIQNVL